MTAFIAPGEVFERDIKPRLRGKGFLVRFADDGVLVFETERDAPSVLAVLSKRFEKYRLKLHPEKTRLLPFHRPKHSASGKAGDLIKHAHPAEEERPSETSNIDNQGTEPEHSITSQTRQETVAQEVRIQPAQHG